MLSGATEGAVPVTLHTGVASLDAMITGSWYQLQIERLAHGEAADPSLARWRAVGWYARDVVRGRSLKLR